MSAFEWTLDPDGQVRFRGFLSADDLARIYPRTPLETRFGKHKTPESFFKNVGLALAVLEAEKAAAADGDLGVRIRLPSPDEVKAAETGNGGWTRARLASWGVPWPPPGGWRKDLERRWKEQNR